ncbi:hypothetical protein ZWY2020_036210 [Hordeum vulgare]|nr:hypothetical protein ZWY2020_036210 [Hordeum vulgare]
MALAGINDWRAEEHVEDNINAAQVSSAPPLDPPAGALPLTESKEDRWIEAPAWSSLLLPLFHDKDVCLHCQQPGRRTVQPSTDDYEQDARTQKAWDAERPGHSLERPLVISCIIMRGRLHCEINRHVNLE